MNGSQAYPLFVFLCEALPTPSVAATALRTDPRFITWSLVCGKEVAWAMCLGAGIAAAF